MNFNIRLNKKERKRLKTNFINPQTRNLPSSTNEDKPSIDQKVDKEDPFTEYGYGFIFISYSSIRGQKEPWYFISWLTYNDNYKNTEMGDIRFIW